MKCRWRGRGCLTLLQNCIFRWLFAAEISHSVSQQWRSAVPYTLEMLKWSPQWIIALLFQTFPWFLLRFLSLPSQILYFADFSLYLNASQGGIGNNCGTIASSHLPLAGRKKKKKKKEFKEIACVKWWRLNCKLHIFGKHESQKHRMAWTGGDLKKQLHLSLFSPPSTFHGHRKVMARQWSHVYSGWGRHPGWMSPLCKWPEVMLHLHCAQETWISLKEEGGTRRNRLRAGSQTSRNHSLHWRERKSWHRDLCHLRSTGRNLAPF